MSADALWTALALLLILEGLLPLVSPVAWRQMFQSLLLMRDGQLRFFGLCCVGLGLVLLWVLF